jgi:phosphatidylserine decarboxylase
MKLFSTALRVFLEAPLINAFLSASVLVSAWFGLYGIAIPCFLLLAFVLYFFRDPQRTPPSGKGLILSTADGTVVKVLKGKHPGMSGVVHRVLIFMSPLDVHRNRAPIAGSVETITYVRGQFLPAFRERIEDLNERNTVVFRSGSLRVLVTQIAGILARRIVCRVSEGERLAAGEEFGLIRFGSANEIVFPAGYRVLVKPGDRVRAGLDVIARVTK